MKAIDTNIIVRFLVGDDHDQAQIVYNLFKKVELNKSELFVPLLLVLELLWVLESAYNIERENIIDSISELTLMPILRFENIEIIQKFAIEAKNNKYDLSDLLIAYTASSCGCETVLTFGKRASKYSLFELIK